MRMRKKKNLEKRLLNCENNLITLRSDDLNSLTAIDKKEYFDFKEMFGNDNPVELEIGCGKGGFICKLAKQNPDKNFIAVEKIGNVIVNGCERAEKENIKNIIFLKCGAEYLPKYFPENSIDNIYLNFSCPYPKKRYENHRLTNGRFLNLYKMFLKKDGMIFQKTDNMHFFEYSIAEFSQNGYALQNVSLDLHNSDFENNIMTEYEKRFSDLGQPIYRLEAYLK
ncbi:MAG: tRNA (guanosine(46)-N7)-methyltransferase TrmB [Clostridia bacterium]|nr:tRNA (guanosine(46)-N7)-methyltransferase TrmB [Clostridia bacterium]